MLVASLLEATMIAPMDNPRKISFTLPIDQVRFTIEDIDIHSCRRRQQPYVDLRNLSFGKITLSAMVGLNHHQVEEPLLNASPDKVKSEVFLKNAKALDFRSWQQWLDTTEGIDIDAEEEQASIMRDFDCLGDVV